MGGKKFAAVCAAAALVLIGAEVCKLFLDARLSYPALVLEITVLAGLVFLCIRTKGGKRWTTAVAAVLIILPIYANVSILSFHYAKRPPAVIHAGGGNYLNSLEMTEAFLREGYRYVELDFLYTEDGALVCSHMFEFGGYSLKNRPTLAEFENIRLRGGYRGLTLSALTALMTEYENFQVVVDTKEPDLIGVLAAIETACEETGVDFFGRFIVQLYSYEDYLMLKSYPFSEFWYTNYKSRCVSDRIDAYFGGEERVTTIVMSKYDWLLQFPFGLPQNKKIAVHTVNGAARARFFAERGVDFIYCDYGIEGVTTC